MSFVQAAHSHKRLKTHKRCPRRSRDFESDLSVQEMLRLHSQRSSPAQKQDKSKTPGSKSLSPPPSILTPEVLQAKPSWLRSKPAAELPCVFTPREEGERQLGEPVELKFWQNAYVRLWDYARANTAGAVAVRYRRGSLARSPHVFALWPAALRERRAPREIQKIKREVAGTLGPWGLGGGEPQLISRPHVGDFIRVSEAACRG